MIDIQIPMIVGGGNRRSNIEGLRLLCMLMVLNLHSFWGYNHGEGVFQVVDFLRESTSICAVNTFLLISGYFGINWKYKSFFNLIFQIFFYSFGVYLVAAYLGFIDFSLRGLFSNAKGLYDSWGFVTGYVLLYICSPFLNSLCEKLSIKQLLVIIIAFYLSSLLICRTASNMNFATMYLIGRFLNKSEAVSDLKINSTKGYWIVTVLITALVFTVYKYTNINTAVTMCGFVFGYSYSGPLVILQAIFLFLIFARMNFTNRFINWCASSCFAIFLIHMHPSIKKIGYYSFTEGLYDKPLFEHVGILFLLFICVFFGSILIDKIRIILSNICYAIILWIKSLLPDKLTSIDTYLPATIKNIL